MLRKAWGKSCGPRTDVFMFKKKPSSCQQEYELGKVLAVVPKKLGEESSQEQNYKQVLIISDHYLTL